MARVAEGFVYCVARLGVTGANDAVAQSAGEVVARVRQATDVPCAIGFGVGNARAAAAAARIADGVIVGSALAAQGPGDGPLTAQGVGELVSSMRRAMDEGRQTDEEGS
jgi:tryptophan synthase alpha chain